MKVMIEITKQLRLGTVYLGCALAAGVIQMAAAQQPPTTPLPPEQLQQLVAPIALYPDALVAQILAASTYPTQIVEAERFIQQNPNLTGAALGAEVDKQDWDPSVKAMTQFPSVLADMDKNLSWTSELGDTNVNQQADIMSGIQFMREKAQAAGHLSTNAQQSVTNQGNTVTIQPENPNIVYVPDYDPEFVYGYPVGLWPGFYPWWGVQGPYLSFGIGFGIDPFFGYGWGWHGWGFDWHNRGLMYGGSRYISRSGTFYNRNAYMHGNFRGQSSFARGNSGLRGYGAAASRGNGGVRSGALSGINHGGTARSYSSRGASSFRGSSSGGSRGAGASRGGGGGSRGGGRR
ncbi:MAG: DUF3300 domain-containing protein [Terracidiphilus sp.]